METKYENKNELILSFDTKTQYNGTEVRRRITNAKLSKNEINPIKLKKGDVIYLNEGLKKRPCVVIKNIKDSVISIPLTSSENIHNSGIQFKSRFFGDGFFGSNFTICHFDVAKDNFVGILDDKTNLNIAINNLKKIVEKL